jgi:hypothetical protein
VFRETLFSDMPHLVAVVMSCGLVADYQCFGMYLFYLYITLKMEMMHSSNVDNQLQDQDHNVTTQMTTIVLNAVRSLNLRLSSIHYNIVSF